jgi:hypothetical protein
MLHDFWEHSAEGPAETSFSQCLMNQCAGKLKSSGKNSDMIKKKKKKKKSKEVEANTLEKPVSLRVSQSKRKPSIVMQYIESNHKNLWQLLMRIQKIIFLCQVHLKLQ